MNQTPLLLRYKIRCCYNGDETSFDPNGDEWPDEWTQYEEPEHRIWRLQLPESDNFIRNSDRKIQYFRKKEYSVVGNTEPILIIFEKCRIGNDSEQTYQLDENHIMYDGYFKSWNENFQKYFCEYERHRSEWETRVFVEKEMSR